MLKSGDSASISNSSGMFSNNGPTLCPAIVFISRPVERSSVRQQRQLRFADGWNAALEIVLRRECSITLSFGREGRVIYCGSR
jgi:hypothetical protein